MSIRSFPHAAALAAAGLLFALFPAFGQVGQNPHPTLAIGAPAPDFSLPGIDGKTHALGEYRSSPLLMIMFICNHCPTSQLYEDRVSKLVSDYLGKGRP